MEQVQINGKTYTMDELCYLHRQYEIFATAEYLIESRGLEENEAIDKAAEVRRIMDKYGYTEEEAILEIHKEN